VGPSSIIPRGSISLSVTFRTPENYRTESVVFDVMEVNLSFNAIIGRLTLYQFIAVAHYGYLVLKMPSPNNIIKIRGDRTAGVVGGIGDCYWLWRAGPGIVELTPACLIFCTSHAALRR
jgi:hypothetical protein